MRSQKKKLTPENDRISVPASWYTKRQKGEKMSKIFKNMIPYWKSILVILVLLFVQAWCDLSLPSYTSDIIDVGIQNSGVEHVTPKRITEEEFQTAEFIMTDDEVDLWESLYTKKDGYYERNKASEKNLMKQTIH